MVPVPLGGRCEVRSSFRAPQASRGQRALRSDRTLPFRRGVSLVAWHGSVRSQGSRASHSLARGRCDLGPIWQLHAAPTEVRQLSHVSPEI